MKSPRRSIASLLLLACSTIAFAQEVPPRPLLDLTHADAPLPAVSSGQVTLDRTTADGSPALAVSIAPGKDAYPGLKIKPDKAATWDLSAYGHIEAKITNTGTQQLVMNLRVDNPVELNDRPWDTEGKRIEPGKTATITVIFGYTFGGIGYPLKADRVNMISLFASGKDAPQSFRIDSLVAGGPAGERLAAADKTARIKPKDGILFNSTMAVKPEQLEAKAGATASAEAGVINLSFPKPSDAQAVSYKPAVGRWHLGDSNEIHIAIQNTGDAPATPRVTLISDWGSATAVMEGKTLAPQETGEIVIPYAALTPWRGMPAEPFNAAKSTVAGSGTDFMSDKTNAVRISAKTENDAPAKLQIQSITAAVSTADLPDWVGKRPPEEGEWTKTFDDEFDGSSIDLAKWNNTGPNYWDKVSHWSKDDVIVADGVCKLRAERKTGTQNDEPAGKQTDQAAGYLDTFGKFRQRYGYFESRMKLPTAPGLWPAFWLMPDRGPETDLKGGSHSVRSSTANGAMEFDIMEHLNVLGPNRYNIAMHWDNYGADHKHTGTGKVYFQPDKDGYVTSGLLWLPGKAIYYCQGKEVAHWEDARISNVPEYIIYTLPIGGWDGNNADGTGFPDDFVIDYVRVWQRNDLQSQSVDPATQPSK